MAYHGERQRVASPKPVGNGNPSQRTQRRAEYRRANPEKERLWRQKWAERNRHVQQANSHTSTLRVRYPEQAERIPVKDLAAWIEPRRGAPCPYCQRPAFHVDHRAPLSRGGEHAFENLQMVCEVCNRAKGALTEAEFLEWISALKAPALEVCHRIPR